MLYTCWFFNVFLWHLSAWYLPFLRSWITMYSNLFSLKQGTTNEAVECTEGSVILWFETRSSACWFLLGLVEGSSLLSAVMKKYSKKFFFLMDSISRSLKLYKLPWAVLNWQSVTVTNRVGIDSVDFLLHVQTSCMIFEEQTFAVHLY